jgi:FkbM family methyltransferase
LQSEEFKHHPAILDLNWDSDKATPDGFKSDALGLVIKNEFDHVDNYVSRISASGVEPGEKYPSFDEEYFEWIDLIESVKASKGTFRIFELGAGYGRWSARAAVVCKQFGKNYELTAAEAEPTHFAWLGRHLANNGIESTKITLINAAVSNKDGHSWFYVGKPADWYGQALASGKDRKRWTKNNAYGYEFAMVETISFKNLFNARNTIDFIDIDVQGAELEVLSSGKKQLDSFVKRIHIGTHSEKIEEGLRKLFGSNLKWKNMFDFSTQKTNNTPYGSIYFLDGVQSWINIKLL